MNVESVLKFTTNPKNGGRGANDSNNKQREEVLKNLLLPTIDHYLSDPVHGPAWTALRTEWLAGLAAVAQQCAYIGYTGIDVRHLGGRRSNVDYVVNFLGCGTQNVEFKYNPIVQDADIIANKPFHPVLYAEHYYNNSYLDRVLALYGGGFEKPTLDVYVRNIHQNKSVRLPFTTRLHDLESAERTAFKAANPGRAWRSRQTPIVHESIHTYLETYKDNTDLDAITTELRRMMTDKHKLNYRQSTGKFNYIQPYKLTQLVAVSVVGIRGERLILQSADPGTHISMRLRWKNRQGIMFPAWQVTFVSASANLVDEAEEE